MRRLVVSDILKGLRKRKADYDEAAMNYKTVGLIGLCSGAGTTQLGIMLANYFSNGLHLKTAIVSAGFDDSFDRIKEEEQVGKVRNYAGSRRGFSYKGIDFFGGVQCHLCLPDFDSPYRISFLPQESHFEMFTHRICQYQL